MKETFKLRNLSVHGYCNGFTSWHYKATNIADIKKEGFFNDAKDLITHGDQIHVSADDGGLLGAFDANKKMHIMSEVLF